MLQVFSTTKIDPGWRCTVNKSIISLRASKAFFLDMARSGNESESLRRSAIVLLISK
jgi:hypothetical protein